MSRYEARGAADGLFYNHDQRGHRIAGPYPDKNCADRHAGELDERLMAAGRCGASRAQRERVGQLHQDAPPDDAAIDDERLPDCVDSTLRDRVQIKRHSHGW